MDEQLAHLWSNETSGARVTGQGTVVCWTPCPSAPLPPFPGTGARHPPVDFQKPLSRLWSGGSGTGPTSCHHCGMPKSDPSPSLTSASPTLPLFFLCPPKKTVCYSLTLSQGLEQFPHATLWSSVLSVSGRICMESSVLGGCECRPLTPRVVFLPRTLKATLNTLPALRRGRASALDVLSQECAFQVR